MKGIWSAMAVAALWLGCQSFKVENLCCEYQSEPLAVENTQPRFGWQWPAGTTGQSSYRIEVYDAAGKLVWFSGDVRTNQSQLIEYQGEELQPGSDYYWRVRVSDRQGKNSAWSQKAHFRTAPADNWLDAHWIGAITREDARIPYGRDYEAGSLSRSPEKKAAWAAVDSLSRKSLYLRKEFRPSGKVAKALVYICGLGHYELTLNGIKQGDAEFAPLWSDYDKTVYYNIYDVSRQLKKDNAFGILLGNGFFNVQGGRYRKMLGSFGAPTLFFKLHVEYTDGRSEDMVSDGSWKYDLSPIVFNDIYGGEDYDARLEQPGWNSPGFDDSSWRNVVLQQAPKGQLRAQSADPVRICERYGVRKISRYPLRHEAERRRGPQTPAEDWTYVLDMGQNLAGFPEIQVRGQAGARIRLTVGESLGRDSLVNQSQSGRPHYYEYTLKGDGLETWHPRFSYYGFRYIQIDGAVPAGQPNPNQLPVIEKVQSCFIFNSAKIHGDFACSNSLFTDIHHLIQMAVRSNMQGNFTDCPHREKLGWQEQNHLNATGLLYTYDMSRYFAKVERDMADAQYENGMVPSTAPNYVEFGGVWQDSPEWGGSAVLLPFRYYEFFGDDRLIREYYPVMKAYVDYLESTSDHHITTCGLGDWYDFGEKRPGFAQNTSVPFVGTAHLYYFIRHVVKAARMQGLEAEADQYEALGKEVLAAFNERFFKADSCIYDTGSQASYAIPLYMGMVAPEYQEQALEHLIADIQAHGNRLTTGEVGNRYMFDYLAEHGQNELMYKMHNHQEVPGYGYQLKFGATTLTEQWDPRQGASWNHFMLGAIDGWFYTSLAGIRFDPEHPGGQHLIVKPEAPGDLSWVKAHTETLYGRVEVEWERTDDAFILHLNLPANTSATVYMPGENNGIDVLGGNPAVLRSRAETRN